MIGFEFLDYLDLQIVCANKSQGIFAILKTG